MAPSIRAKPFTAIRNSARTCCCYAKTLKRSMRQVHHSGEKLFNDYACLTLELTDASRAHIFVAALGASSYTYA